MPLSPPQPSRRPLALVSCAHARSRPPAAGKKSLVEKSGEKRKASEKGTTQRKKAKPAKAEKKKRPKTAYQLYADSR